MATIPSSKFVLEAIPRGRVYTEVARQLQEHIVGELKPGDMLPPERELVQQFGVSRSSIRDAIRRLEAVGLLEPKQGVGTVVRDGSSELVSTPVTNFLMQKRKAIRELLDVRMIIEPALAWRAAIHAKADQIAEMEAILTRQQEKLLRDEPAIEEDSAFHFAIAQAADNSVMLKLVSVLMDLLREMRQRSLQVNGRQRKSLASHRRILAALRAHDPAGAQAAMQAHLLELERIVLQKS